jgi:hypothetical protein
MQGETIQIKARSSICRHTFVFFKSELFPTVVTVNSARAEGVLAPRLLTLDGSAHPPTDTSGNFPAHMSAESPLNTSPNPSEVIS